MIQHDNVTIVCFHLERRFRTRHPTSVSPSCRNYYCRTFVYVFASRTRTAAASTAFFQIVVVQIARAYIVNKQVARLIGTGNCFSVLNFATTIKRGAASIRIRSRIRVHVFRTRNYDRSREHCWKIGATYSSSSPCLKHRRPIDEDFEVPKPLCTRHVGVTELNNFFFIIP